MPPTRFAVSDMMRLCPLILLGIFCLASCSYIPQPWEGEMGDAAEIREAREDAAAAADYQADQYADIVRQATIDAIVADDKASLTAEAGEHAKCPGGCTTYPEWCDPAIKGNVSFNSGERIYHMPHDEFYDETKIDPDYAERYFCTPEEAEAAGFRRAHN